MHRPSPRRTRKDFTPNIQARWKVCDCIMSQDSEANSLLTEQVEDGKVRLDNCSKQRTTQEHWSWKSRKLCVAQIRQNVHKTFLRSKKSEQLLESDEDNGTQSSTCLKAVNSLVTMATDSHTICSNDWCK